MIGLREALAVFAGGGIGSVLRYLITYGFIQRAGAGYAWLPTFAINVSGSFAIGFAAEILLTRANVGTPIARLFFLTGVLGGYTTFSTFSFDALQLFADRAAMLAVAYAGGSVILGVAAAFAGVAFARSI